MAPRGLGTIGGYVSTGARQPQQGPIPPYMRPRQRSKKWWQAGLTPGTGGLGIGKRPELGQKGGVYSDALFVDDVHPPTADLESDALTRSRRDALPSPPFRGSGFRVASGQHEVEALDQQIRMAAAEAGLEYQDVIAGFAALAAALEVTVPLELQEDLRLEDVNAYAMVLQGRLQSSVLLDLDETLTELFEWLTERQDKIEELIVAAIEKLTGSKSFSTALTWFLTYLVGLFATRRIVTLWRWLMTVVTISPRALAMVALVSMTLAGTLAEYILAGMGMLTRALPMLGLAGVIGSTAAYLIQTIANTVRAMISGTLFKGPVATAIGGQAWATETAAAGGMGPTLVGAVGVVDQVPHGFWQAAGWGYLRRLWP
jgi:hypothetical protein